MRGVVGGPARGRDIEYAHVVERVLFGIEVGVLPVRGQERIANALNNTGILYFVWGEHDQALDYYFRSLKIRRELEDRDGLARGYNNVAGIYQTAGDFAQAMSYFRQSLAIYEELTRAAARAAVVKGRWLRRQRAGISWPNSNWPHGL